MRHAEYYKLSGHLFEVVPTQGNGHIGYLKACPEQENLFSVTELSGEIRYFSKITNGTGGYVEVDTNVDNILPLKTA